MARLTGASARNVLFEALGVPYAYKAGCPQDVESWPLGVPGKMRSFGWDQEGFVQVALAKLGCIDTELPRLSVQAIASMGTAIPLEDGSYSSGVVPPGVEPGDLVVYGNRRPEQLGLVVSAEVLDMETGGIIRPAMCIWQNGRGAHEPLPHQEFVQVMPILSRWDLVGVFRVRP